MWRELELLQRGEWCKNELIVLLGELARRSFFNCEAWWGAEGETWGKSTGTKVTSDKTTGSYCIWCADLAHLPSQTAVGAAAVTVTHSSWRQLRHFQRLLQPATEVALLLGQNSWLITESQLIKKLMEKLSQKLKFSRVHPKAVCKTTVRRKQGSVFPTAWVCLWWACGGGWWWTEVFDKQRMSLKNHPKSPQKTLVLFYIFSHQMSFSQQQVNREPRKLVVNDAADPNYWNQHGDEWQPSVLTYFYKTMEAE